MTCVTLNPGEFETLIKDEFQTIQSFENEPVTECNYKKIFSKRQEFLNKLRSANLDVVLKYEYIKDTQEWFMVNNINHVLFGYDFAIKKLGEQLNKLL